MVDVSPLIPAGRQVVQSYGGGGFRITGERWEGAVLVLPTLTQAWSATAWAEVTAESLAPLHDSATEPTTLLLGTGEKQLFPTRALKDALRAHGLVVEAMDTGAACRTYNVLMSESRKVAAALLPIA